MQLPIFNLDPTISARQSPDLWCKKLGIEASQLIATCYKDLSNAPLTVTGKVRSNKSHLHHPITKWIGQSLDNFWWAFEYGLTCIQESFDRGLVKSAHHECFYNWCFDNPPDIPNIGITKFYKMNGYEHLPVEQSYQVYFNDKKQHLAVWTNRQIPDWFENKS